MASNPSHVINLHHICAAFKVFGFNVDTSHASARAGDIASALGLDPNLTMIEFVVECFRQCIFGPDVFELAELREAQLADAAKSIPALKKDAPDDSPNDYPDLESFEAACREVQAGTDDTIYGFKCGKCKKYNVVRSARNTWYVVYKGLEPGVYQGIFNVDPLVKGISHAYSVRFPNEAAARASYEEALAREGHVEKLTA